MSEQFSTEHIAKAVEKLIERPEQSIADDLKAYFTQMLKNADFVQVVRCMDCKYYTLIPGNLLNIDPHYGCVHSRGCTEPTIDGYCSYGERRG